MIVKSSGFHAVICLCTSVLFAACHSENQPPSQTRPVIAEAAHPDSETPSILLPGDIEARYRTPLSFRIAGKIIERKVQLGETVRKGQLVAVLDSSDPAKNLASARAQLEAATHSLTYAWQQVVRDRQQHTQNLISTAQLEQTQNAYASALAQQQQMDEQFKLARNQLQYTRLVADHTGYITAELADTGQNVSAGQTVYQLAWSDSVDAIVDAPESVLKVIAPDQPATVRLPSLPDHIYTARVREVAPAADPQSRTYRVKLSLLHPDAHVHLGMTAEIAFERPSDAVGDTALYTLPATALFHEGDSPAVWVVTNPGNALQLRRVSVARYDEHTITVSSGLRSGELVVMQGVHTVSAGEKVRVIAPLHSESVTP